MKKILLSFFMIAILISPVFANGPHRGGHGGGHNSYHGNNYHGGSGYYNYNNIWPWFGMGFATGIIVTQPPVRYVPAPQPIYPACWSEPIYDAWGNYVGRRPYCQ